MKIDREFQVEGEQDLVKETRGRYSSGLLTVPPGYQIVDSDLEVRSAIPKEAVIKDVVKHTDSQGHVVALELVADIRTPPRVLCRQGKGRVTGFVHLTAVPM